MKKQYEKNELILWSCIIFFILIFVFLIFLINKKVILYKSFNGIVSVNNVLEFVLTDEELDIFYKNKVFYIDNKKKKYKIKKVDNAVLKRGGEKYNYVYIETDISSLLKVNDVVKISIMEKRIKSVKIFKVIWDGDLN